MPFINVLINVPSESIQTLNGKVQKPTKVREAINSLINLLDGIEAGTTAASLQVTTLNSTITVATDGGQSQQNTYNKL